MNEDVSSPCPLTRRISAVIYDGLILAGLWMIAAALVVVPAGDAIDVGTHWFQLFLLAVAFAYFGGCWHYGGQTVGMRAWKIWLVGESTPPAWRALALRFAVGALSTVSLGLGFWWAATRQDRATWHDLASSTRLVVGEPQARRSNT